MVLVPWGGHTERSRRDALAFRQALAAWGRKYAEVAALLGISEKQLCRQLAGVDPLNHWRIAELPDEFQALYDARRAELRGAVLLEADVVTLIRAAMILGKRSMLKIAPQLVHERRVS